MTQTLGLDANHDIYLAKDGNLAVLRGIEAVQGACETACLALLREMVFAQNRGLPYFQAVWVGSPNYPVFRQALISTLMGVDGVQSVQSLAFSVDNHVLKYNATIQTRFGKAEITNG